MYYWRLTHLQKKSSESLVNVYEKLVKKKMTKKACNVHKRLLTFFLEDVKDASSNLLIH
jgi:hypothetical protein